LLGFFVFFMVLQMLFVRFYLVSVESAKHLQIELLQQGQKHFSIVVFKKENKEHKKLNERLSERKEAFRAGKLDQDLSGLKMKPQPFTWEHLNYTVPVKGGQKQLLNDVFGYVKPGTLTALMGASGAGKVSRRSPRVSRLIPPR
jgi:ATP-binding cassette subfamily G (WHITE) protein 2 (SNQ2)